MMALFFQLIFLLGCLIYGRKVYMLVFFTAVAMLHANSSLAQEDGRVKGTVVSETGEAVSHGTVALLNAADSVLVKTTLTNESGNFDLIVRPGRYLVQVTASGLLQQNMPLIVVEKQPAASAVVIRLQRMTRVLEAVKIVSKKPLIERKVDRTVVNVDALISNAGSNALEVLELSPGVRVDNDAISLNGKQNVTIYIDDKPTYLQGSDLASYLRSIPAGQLDKIEIMPNPSARYDAAGNGGIINIKLKKIKNKGFNGSFVSENIRGRRSRLSQSGSFNWRNNRVNLYGNITYYKGTGLAVVNSNRNYMDSSSNLRSLTQLSTINSPNWSWQGKAGIDWSASPKTTWSMYISRFSRALEMETSLSSRQAYSNATDSLTDGINNMYSRTGNTSVHADFRHVYDTSGKELSVTADYTCYGFDDRLQNINSSYKNGGSNVNKEILNGDLSDRINILSAKADYVHPFNRHTKIETGYKASIITTRNNAVYTGVINDTIQAGYAADNLFRYNENIYAGYLNYHTQFKSMEMQLGARVEHTRSAGRQTGGMSFTRNYTQLFPTVFLSWQPDSSNTHRFQFSYGRRIARPGYANLNPFATPRDRYTYSEGNPLLRPELSRNFELSYIFRNDITVSFFYNQLKDAINETVITEGDLIYNRPDNIGRSIIRGFSLNGSWHPVEWWQSNASMLYAHTQLRSVLYDKEIFSQGQSWSLTVTQQLTLKKGWSAELLTDYSSAQVYAQYRDAATWYMHAGIGKKIWKDKGSLRLNVRDVFYTRRDRQDYLAVSGITGFSSRKWDTRSVTLAFTYRFTKGNKAVMRKTDTSEENKRLGE